MYLRPSDVRVTRRASWLMSRAVLAQQALGLAVVLLCIHMPILPAIEPDAPSRPRPGPLAACSLLRPEDVPSFVELR